MAKGLSFKVDMSSFLSGGRLLFDWYMDFWQGHTNQSELTKKNRERTKLEELRMPKAKLIFHVLQSLFYVLQSKFKIYRSENGGICLILSKQNCAALTFTASAELE